MAEAEAEFTIAQAAKMAEQQTILKSIVDKAYMEANRQFLRQEQAAYDALFSELNTDIEEEKAGAEQPEARELQPVITHKYRGSQQLSIVEYST